MIIRASLINLQVKVEAAASEVVTDVHLVKLKLVVGLVALSVVQLGIEDALYAQ